MFKLCKGEPQGEHKYSTIRGTYCTVFVYVVGVQI